MKKFVNDPANFVPEFMKGVMLANPDLLEAVPEFQMIKRKDRPVADKVSIVQGSGSGHEPAHVMAVGPGMLDGACQGPVFAAPPVDACYETIKALASDAGVLVLVNNYQGDRMAWDMACEMAEAEGIKVKQFLINDDVAVKDSLYTVGRRGVAGNFFVIKACGAAAAAGKSLDEVLAVAEKVNNNVRTMGVALTSCIPPAKGTPIFEIGDDEMEVGIGIHGEPGRERTKITSADEITKTLFDAVQVDLPFESGDKVALMINGLGGTPISELYLLYGKAHELAEEHGLTVARNYVGEYCTSLEMAGCSLTMLKLDDELADLLAAPAEVAIRTF
ncbi:dihydroxyacetone kinase-like protein [Altererythrobacter atlanticus]|uniref:PTS-dependent dihydroxyacetone kinase, dihydroxyacetone-binding subunit DhaK n=1 Tax=Croceibacterium atlanticum TaxID=1267766 RepID=A0A0F7KYW8_9SPHN|nr:dihydroxyacetone kinase subunit DhaK [Croceibacterium atlanticum]AKH44015.1 PTS-dependent dihydroxyacetone kinase, dihydroxyacetone-binding subunit DhaK [Croceibacterium atlanticum]MBB5732322.1 dihydroxyacetone kinase-like protein [Croceibacterium atlanticum]